MGWLLCRGTSVMCCRDPKGRETPPSVAKDSRASPRTDGAQLLTAAGTSTDLAAASQLWPRGFATRC